MAIPDAGLILHQASSTTSSSSSTDSDARPDAAKHPAQLAILCKIDHDTLQEVQEAYGAKKSLQFVSGSLPSLRIGTRVIDLTMSAESFRHELYTAALAPYAELHFAGLISHRAELKASGLSGVGGAEGGSDAALAALQSSLASHQQKKEAQSSIITASVLAPPKNRHDAAREQRQAARQGPAAATAQKTAWGRGAGATSSSQQPPATVASPSVPNRAAAQAHAMRVTLVHLLAIRPLARSDVQIITRIPRLDLDDVLSRVGNQQTDSKWALAPRAYKELDVWKFPYPSAEERQWAIDNAVKAYDRLRLGKEDKEWQMLLAPEERGKGKVLSKLLASGNAVAVATPVVGVTPKVGAAKGDAVVSRLLSKDPKKARAAEEAKVKKRKEREGREAQAAEASDKEGGKPARKRQATGKGIHAKYKSDELVHSSADEESADNAPSGQRKSASTNLAKPAAATLRVENKAGTKTRKAPLTAPGKLAPKPKPALLEEGKKQSPAPSKTIKGKTEVPNRKPAIVSSSASSSSSSASKPLSGVNDKSAAAAAAAAARRTGKATPNILSTQSAHRTQHSPQASGRHPTVPSPLGATRPRGVSNASPDRAAWRAQRPQLTAPASSKAMANGAKKAHADQGHGSSAAKANGNARSIPDHPRTTNGVTARKAPVSNANARAATPAASTKRKMDDSPQPQPHDDDALSSTAPAAKHRKTDSAGTTTTLIRGGGGGGGSTSHSKSPSGSSPTSSIIDNVTFKQAVDLAEQYQKFYPRYTELYDKVEAQQARHEPILREEYATLLRMHERLKQMKAEIRAGAEKEHVDD